MTNVADAIQAAHAAGKLTVNNKGVFEILVNVKGHTVKVSGWISKNGELHYGSIKIP